MNRCLVALVLMVGLLPAGACGSRPGAAPPAVQDAAPAPGDSGHPDAPATPDTGSAADDAGAADVAAPTFDARPADAPPAGVDVPAVEAAPPAPCRAPGRPLRFGGGAIASFEPATETTRPSIAADAGGTPSVSFFANHNLWFSQRQDPGDAGGEVWVRRSVLDFAPSNPPAPSVLRVTSRGEARLAFIWGTSLQFASWSGRLEDPVHPLSHGYEITSFSLALDGAGRPHLAFSRSPALYYQGPNATGDGFAARSEVGPAHPAQLTLDPSGAPVLAWLDKDGVHAGSLHDGRWSFELAHRPSADPIFGHVNARVQVDRGGTTHVVFLTPREGLHHVWRAPDGWHDQLVAARPELTGYASDGPYVDFVLVETGVMHILYVVKRQFDSTTPSDLVYVRGDSCGFTSAVVASGPQVGLRPSLAVDGHGIAHVAYEDTPAKELRYARLLEP